MQGSIVEIESAPWGLGGSISTFVGLLTGLTTLGWVMILNSTSNEQNYHTFNLCSVF